MQAKDVKVGMTIIDQMNYEIVVDDTWPDQGMGLGVAIIGHRTDDSGANSFNRYVKIETDVQVVDS